MSSAFAPAGAQQKQEFDTQVLISAKKWGVSVHDIPVARRLLDTYRRPAIVSCAFLAGCGGVKKRGESRETSVVIRTRYSPCGIGHFDHRLASQTNRAGLENDVAISKRRAMHVRLDTKKKGCLPLLCCQRHRGFPGSGLVASGSGILGYSDRSLNLYLLHRVELIDLASAILGDRARAEDIVQEAFLRWNSADARLRPEQPVGYLKRIVRNLSLDALRRCMFEGRMFDASALTEEIGETAPSPEQIAIDRDELAAVLKALDALPPRTRLAVELYRFQGCKLKDIALRLDISVSLAHSLVVDGLEACRRQVARTK